MTTLAPKAVLAQVPAPGSEVFDPGSTVSLQADPTDADTFVPPPPAARAAPGIKAAASATFQTTYTGFTPEAQAAFEYAIGIWAGLITSPVPIKVSARYEALAVGTLANARTDRVRDFAGAPLAGTLYPLALANAFAGSDLNPSATGITIRMSSAFNDSWYFGTDGRPPSGKFDFVSVALHELGHGLGFDGTMRASSGGTASWGSGDPRAPTIYDRFTTDANRASLIDTTVYPNSSVPLLTALTSEAVYFESPLTNGSDGSGRPKLFAPQAWAAGSSYVHLDEPTYPPGNPHSLMTPVLSRDETVHSPGAISLCILEAMGWSTSQTCPAGVENSATVLSATVAEPGDAITASATGVASANSSYILKAGSTVFNCPTGISLGGAALSDSSFNIPPVRRILPTNATSGNRWLCWVGTGGAGDSSTPVRILIV